MVPLPENGTKTEPSQYPKKVIFLIEICFSSVYKSYLSVLNRFYSSSTTEQKVHNFGPVLVLFPKNGTKKRLIVMKIASFPWKVVENVPNNLKLPSENGCVVFSCFSIRVGLVPFLVPFPENETKTEPPQNPEIVIFFLKDLFLLSTSQM